ncbi:MAG TPA: SpoIIE family protein phosphatase, partial [Flavobacteriales bacterium]|nr:SpoIIE family protein phosphatase [Flavobacteriales bacterium]
QIADEQLAAVLQAQPGRERVGRLVELAAHERRAGKCAQAVELALQGATEAERLGLDAELSNALIELSRAQLARGDRESAMRAGIRAVRLMEDSTAEARSPALLQLADIYLREGYPQKALEYLNELAPENHLGTEERSARTRLTAQAMVRSLPPEEAMRFAEAAMSKADRSKDKTLLHELRTVCATAAARSGANEKALDLERGVMEGSLLRNDEVQAGISANNIGELLLRLGRTEEAIAALQQATIMLDEQPGLKLGSLVNLAHAQAKNGQHVKAMRTLDEGMQLVTVSGRTEQRPRLLRARAGILLGQGDLPEAYAKAQEALEQAEAQKSEEEQQAGCELLAAIAERMGEPTEARIHARRAREHAQKVADQLVQERLARDNDLLRWQRLEREETEEIVREQRKESELRQLALDADNKEKQLALLTYEMQLQEADRREESMARERAQQALQLAEAALEAERQERMIKELDHTRLMQDLNVGRMELERKDHQHSIDLLEQKNEVIEAKSQVLEADRSRQRVMKRGSIILSVVALLVAGYMTWAWIMARKKKRTIWRQHQQIVTINEELADKNANIESSISYARTIQSTIVATEDALKAVLPQSFLFYKPLDKVSGDLPFVRQVGHRVFLAAIDCTGHGVPAAMMTFIAYYGLSELITQRPDAPAGALLDDLHEHVKRTMEARNGAGLYNDGMDIGLCAIDLRTGEGTFAGAQLPLLLERAGQIERVKGDMLPLGDNHFARQAGYQSHALQLQPNDTIFLFSDGIIHQFGGPDGQNKFSHAA